jgi:hypothetical protein
MARILDKFGMDDIECLRCLGGWIKDRHSGGEGLTIAGILMFGNLRPIWDAVPHYCVDFQERSEAKTEARWFGGTVGFRNPKDLPKLAAAKLAAAGIRGKSKA